MAVVDMEDEIFPESATGNGFPAFSVEKTGSVPGRPPSPLSFELLMEAPPYRS